MHPEGSRPLGPGQTISAYTDAPRLEHLGRLQTPSIYNYK